MKHLDPGFMGKKTGKRHERNGASLQIGCVSGLLNMFDFRNGRRRLVTDRRSPIKEPPRYCVNERDTQITEDPKEEEIKNTPQTRISVKKLMEEDMINESFNNSKVSPIQITLENNPKTRDKFGAKPLSFEPQSLISNSIEDRINTECFINNDFLNVLDKLSAEALNENDHAFVASVKLLIEQKLKTYEEENSSSCEEFMDSVKIFTANYGLFLDVLHKSKSTPIRLPVSNSKQRKVLRRRSNSLESFLRGGNESSSFENEVELKETVDKLIHNHSHRDENSKSSKGNSLREKMRWDSRIPNSFDTERSQCRNGSHGGFNLYIEAKKHISEMVTNSNENSNSITREFSISLGRILCDSIDSRECDDIPLNLQSSMDQNMSKIDAMISYEDETKLCIESSSISEGATGAVNKDEDLSTSLKTDFGVFSTPFSTSNSRVSKEIEDCDQGSNKLEQPSPVSVLEPEESNSPASIYEQVREIIEPKSLNLEQAISMEDEESPFEYIEAVLLGSGLNWEEFHLKWLSSSEIIDSYLFDEIEPFSKQKHSVQKLLFDCVNEALMSICEFHFCWFKYVKESIPSSVDLVNEIWREVEFVMLHKMKANCVDKIVRMELRRCGKWIKFEEDIEDICYMLEEAIFDELIEYTSLGFDKVVE